MRFNFKKVASVLASAAMIGSTMGIAAAAAYPSPFVAGGAANVAIVIGANAATIDNIAAVDISADLQAELAKQTATTTTTAVSSSDESVNLASGTTSLYFNSSLNDARTSLTKNELPTLLADGEVVDDSGTSYSYKQSITMGSRKVQYSTSGGDMDDPELLIEVGTDAVNYAYRYELTFNKNINVTNSDVQGNEIEVLGQKYVVGANSIVYDTGTDILYLYGSGVSKTMSEGESATVTVAGKDYTIEVSSIDSSSRVSVSVDGGTTRRISEGTSVKVGDLEIYAKQVNYLAKEAQVSYADLNIGSKKVKLQHGTTVKEGSDETSIYGTEADIASAAGKLSGFSVNMSMQKTTSDYIPIGSSFTDPVFGGIKLQFAAVTPGLDAATRETIKVDTDNSRNAKVTFTSALAGDAGEITFNFAHDEDTSDSTIDVTLANTANKTIHVMEGEKVVINEYMVINAGDYGRIVKLTEVPTSNQPLETTSRIQFEDAITGQNLFEGGLTVGTSGNASTNIDGQPYYFGVGNGTTAHVNVTWGSGATYSYVGSQTTVFPRIKLAQGGWLAILKPQTLPDAGTYVLPGVQTLATYEAGSAINNNSGDSGAEGLGRGSEKSGNVNFTIEFSTAAGNANNTIVGIDTNGDGDLTSGEDCLFNATAANGAAILLVEEKKPQETNNADNGDAICVNVDASGSTTPVEVSVSTPVTTDTHTNGLQSLTSDSNLRRMVTRYGTYVEYDSTDNDAVSIKYPDNQMYADILVAAVGAEVTTTGGSTGTGVVSLGSVAVMDSEIDTVSSKNLIVVGGSCINTVAAKLLGSDSPICGATFTEKTGIGAGQFLIEAFDSPYATGKVAMLVAGYEGADTRKAVTYLTANKPSTTVGTTLKKVTATYEDVATTTETETETA